MDHLLYGAAYYDEYMPCERLAEDVKLMKKAGVNVVRIAESTWSTCEPQEGVFDFSHVERVMDAMEEAGIHVIIGTPTYAVPTWMVKSYPDVLATTVRGRGIYGARQIMDITHPVYRFYSERVIRKLMEHTARRKCVIGYQVDNETKYYGTAGNNVQEKFVKYLREKFHNDLDALNAEFGLDYWSNRINAWEDFPDVRGTINGSLGAEFEKFQRTLVDDFLAWQAGIINEYRREDQFITHNFDFEWRGYSYGVQTDVDHYHAARPLTIAGADIYHPTQEDLTGKEIAFGGDLIRSLKRSNYMILETEAQGFPGWTPYPGQLRLQAWSHIASGAESVMYWHWHSIHNSLETYWKGLLSHDFAENETYREACTIGRDFNTHSEKLIHLRKKNRAAILVSNEALTALKWFGIEATASDHGKLSYNDVVRWIYDALYEMNVECDFLWPESEHLEEYDVIFVPALYAAPDELLRKLCSYTEKGGTLFVTFKSGFANEYVKVNHDVQPHILRDCLGVEYHQFTFPKNVGLENAADRGGVQQQETTEHTPEMTDGCSGIISESETLCGREARHFMELLIPQGAKVLLKYRHPAWGSYAALTEHTYGKGKAYYLGCMTGSGMLKEILKYVLGCAGMAEELEPYSYPVIVRKGKNQAGHTVRFYMNYSGEEQRAVYLHGSAEELLNGQRVESGEELVLPAWGVCILEECGC